MHSDTPQQVTLRSTEVQRNFREVVNRAGSGQEHIIVERDGLPVIVILSVAEYQSLMHERELRAARRKQLEETARRIGREIARRGLSEEEVLTQLDQTQQELYDEHYDQSSA